MKPLIHAKKKQVAKVKTKFIVINNSIEYAEFCQDIGGSESVEDTDVFDNLNDAIASIEAELTLRSSLDASFYEIYEFVKRHKVEAKRKISVSPRRS